jgi:hypothetical protein
VTRVVNDWVAYVHDPAARATYSFTPIVVRDYAGESFTELKIQSGQTIEFAIDDDAKVTSVIPPARRLVSDATRDDDEVLGAPDGRDPGSDQAELHPDAPARGQLRFYRAIPRPTRQFRKFVDTSVLRAGDLLLTRQKETDKQHWTSSEITRVQLEGGYEDVHARWTHAALYLGDGAHVVEATVDGMQGNIRMTSLDEYCVGADILRFRRPQALVNDQQTAWVFCIRALSRLREAYDFTEAARIWFKVILKKTGFWSSEFKPGTTKAVMCSTFYSDAFNEATGRRLSEMNGICVPAWLSLSNEFEDVQTHWLQIV